jgi:polyhydroxyalkanoate synthesis regulator phasin
MNRNGNIMDKTELVIQALQQRIGEIVSQYETHIAVLRAEITQLLEQIQKMEVPAEQPKE